MKPIRINLSDYNKEKFVELAVKLFNLEDKERVESFYDEVTTKYIQVILDLESGELIQAFTNDGYWVLSKYYLDKTLTPKKLKELEQEQDDKTNENNDIMAKQKLDQIFEKISKDGQDSLTRSELKFLKDNSHLI